METRPVKDNPVQAIKGARGRNHPKGRLSERWPNTGWIIEEVRLVDRRMIPDIVYERFIASLKNGRRAVKAPWLTSVTRWAMLRMARAFLFSFIGFPT